ncbi:MAG: hypothetical protein OXU81_21685, partial [Gammaproteobacteria bacterium]|nr:hypothetical protein [Gammaproteobacteria bacterium]
MRWRLDRVDEPVVSGQDRRCGRTPDARTGAPASFGIIASLPFFSPMGHVMPRPLDGIDKFPRIRLGHAPTPLDR